MAICLRPLGVFLKQVSRKRFVSMFQIHTKMSTFISTINPTTGKQEWIQQIENYDYQQEIAR